MKLSVNELGNVGKQEAELQVKSACLYGNSDTHNATARRKALMMILGDFISVISGVHDFDDTTKNNFLHKERQSRKYR
jgi:hypothetical protein